MVGNHWLLTFTISTFNCSRRGEYQKPLPTWSKMWKNSVQRHVMANQPPPPRGREKLGLFRVCVANAIFAADPGVQAKKLQVQQCNVLRKFGSSEFQPRHIEIYIGLLVSIYLTLSHRSARASTNWLRVGHATKFSAEARTLTAQILLKDLCWMCSRKDCSCALKDGAAAAPNHGPHMFIISCVVNRRFHVCVHTAVFAAEQET